MARQEGLATTRYPSVEPSGSICHRHMEFDCSSPKGLGTFYLARQEGLEPPTYCLEGSCSIRLSYWRIIDGAGDGNRTRVSSLEGWCSTIELHPHSSASRIQLVNSNIDLFGCQAPKWFFILDLPHFSQINCNLKRRALHPNVALTCVSSGTPGQRPVTFLRSHRRGGYQPPARHRLPNWNAPRRIPTEVRPECRGGS